MFGALGDDVESVIRTSPRGFEVSLNRGRCEILRLAGGEAEVRITDCYLFPDCFLVGAIEGTCAHYGRDALVEIRAATASSCEFFARW